MGDQTRPDQTRPDQTRPDQTREAWKHGSMEAWKRGSMEAWKHGSMEAWKHGSMGTGKTGKTGKQGNMETGKTQHQHLQPNIKNLRGHENHCFYVTIKSATIPVAQVVAIPTDLALDSRSFCREPRTLPS